MGRHNSTLLIETCNLFGYGEIGEKGMATYRRSSDAPLSIFNDRLRNKERFIGVPIDDKEDVYPALKEFLASAVWRREQWISTARGSKQVASPFIAEPGFMLPAPVRKSDCMRDANQTGIICSAIAIRLAT